MQEPGMSDMILPRQIRAGLIPSNRAQLGAEQSRGVIRSLKNIELASQTGRPGPSGATGQPYLIANGHGLAASRATSLFV